ncbi:hypothetical protein AAE478_006589 [Parahypoxylon ruwenzoriense]
MPKKLLHACTPSGAEPSKFSKGYSLIGHTHGNRFIDGLRKEIESLKRQSAQQQQQQQEERSNISSSPVYSPSPGHPGGWLLTDGSNEDQAVDPIPMPHSGPWFDNSNAFHTPILIGEAADAAFATRFRQVVSCPDEPQPTHLLRLNYATNEALMTLACSSDVAWPSPSRARLLVRASLKHVNRCYYIVDRAAVLDGVDQIALDPVWGGPLLRCKFWALFAIGELSTTRSRTVTQNYPGLGYFAQASKMLGYLDERPGKDTVEILLLLSFYSLALNRRYSAYTLAGSAMRSAIVMGLHLNISETQLSDPSAREHRKRLFWTAYILDRVFGANLNLPAAIQDDEIEVDLPSQQVPASQPLEHGLGGNDYDREYHVAKIKLAGHLTNIIRSVYNPRRRNQDTNLSTRVQQALKGLQDWVYELPSHLQINKSLEEGINDLKVVSLHLSFFHCTILATRPVLLHALRVKVTALRAGTQFTSSQLPSSASALSEACIRCARHSVQILTQSWIEGSFVTFDCFFTQYLFSSLTVLAISSLLNENNKPNGSSDPSLFEEASSLSAQLKDSGNIVAEEYCHHVDAIRAVLAAGINNETSSRMGMSDVPDMSSSRPDAAPQITQNLPQELVPTATMPWNEHSLQTLLSQPTLDLQFLEDAIRDGYSQDLFWPPISGGG